MSYAIIDPTIRAWAKRHSLKLFNTFAGREERFCYISSAKGECFQISIGSPVDKNIKIDAWSVETLDDREMHQQWVTSVLELDNALQAAFDKVTEWLK